MQKKTVAFSKDSSNLFFHILTRCNLACSHCYINREQHGENTLDIATIKQWLALFAGRNQTGDSPEKEAGDDYGSGLESGAMNVVFLGGEPTLHKDLALAVKEARRLGFKSITIDTNGYLFHDILDRVTPDEVDFISFSLDGATKKTNDAIRGEGCYQTCLKGIKEAVAKGFDTSMIYTVSQANLGELEMMPELVSKLGIQRFFIQVIGIRGESVEEGDGLQVSRENWLDIVPAVAEEIAASGIIVTYPKVFLDGEEPFQCAGTVADNYFVFPNARVYRCPVCEDYPLHSLEIQENRLVKTGRVNEADLFNLTIPEGCVMNKLVQPGNLAYHDDNTPKHRIACCMLKQEVRQIT
ncbi:MAG TPA: radical SAM protein [Desulfobacteraceae bacterium]|nr:radical SAM protein [Desulfobacteraceae bacterium]